MKKALALLLVLLTASFVFAGGASESTTTAATETQAAAVPEEFHIGIVTGTVSQSEDDLRGAEALIAEYGSVADGGMIQHLTYPDNFMEEQETTISVIAGLADDPLMKAVIVNQAVPGTTEAFRRIKEARPDIIWTSYPVDISSSIQLMSSDVIHSYTSHSHVTSQWRQ